jgi:GH15 family glucan-1,4-alpha-glucosidase
MGGRPRRLPPGELAGLHDSTARFWRGWLARSAYRGRWRDMVSRSAMTLKLMTYAPTGAPVAALTAGLPEQVGGERNWDYRYTWIRDGSFSIGAPLGLGYTEEAAAFGTWLLDRVTEQAGHGSGPLKIMYRVDGSSDLSEETLDHFEGWRGSRPVRIGNGAADQLQLDIYGEALDGGVPRRRARPAGRSPRVARSRTRSTGCASTGTSQWRLLVVVLAGRVARRALATVPWGHGADRSRQS